MSEGYLCCGYPLPTLGGGNAPLLLVIFRWLEGLDLIKELFPGLQTPKEELNFEGVDGADEPGVVSFVERPSNFCSFCKCA